MVDADYLASETRRILDEWNNKGGHDRCFSHNDTLGQLLALYSMQRNPQVNDLTEEELAQGCEVYRAMLHGKPIPKGLEHIASKIKL